MAAFDYIYFDIDGKKKKGSREAADKDKLIAILKAEDKMPLKVTEQNILNKNISFQIGNPVKARDLAVFCRQLHSILTAGITISSALEMLGNETENKVLAKAAKETKKAVEKGEALSQAMRVHNNVFSPFLIHMMEAGEISGKFDEALLSVAEHFEKDAKLRAVIRKATVYPIILGMVSVIVVVVMLLKVIPSFMGMFEEIDVKMPAVTMAVVHLSKFMVRYWLLLLCAVILIIVGMKLWKASDTGKEYLGRTCLKLPILGRLFVKSASARFGRTLSTLLAAGIPITRALEITANSIDNVIIRRDIINTRDEVERGVSMADTLEAYGTFPPMVSNMIKIGEQTGTTRAMLVKVAQYYEDDVENATASAMALLEPIMIVIMAFIIGFLLIAMFQPVITMYQGMRHL